MYNIHLKEEVSTLRVFKLGDSYEKKSTPLFSCTVHFISDYEVYICKGLGEINMRGFRELLRYFKDSGCKVFRYERHNEMRVINL